MEGKRILYVSSELTPYSPENLMANLSLQMPKLMQQNGNDVRIFMPCFGTINERRHQLHEVIRLSGMNLIIDDNDQPLIIKVASVPAAKLQVYFIDNDEYFKRKGTYDDEAGKFYEDNDERAIFFAKGVLETVKKLNWKPDIVHICGWMPSLVPLYLKKHYNDDVFFNEAKIVVSIFNKQFQGSLSNKLVSKLEFDGFKSKDVEKLKDASYENMMIQAIDYADAVLQSDEIIPAAINDYALSKGITLSQHPLEKIIEVYGTFYEEEIMN